MIAQMDALSTSDRRWFPTTNANAPSGYRAINIHLKNASVCPILYCDENGTVLFFPDLAGTALPTTLSNLTSIYLNNANNIEAVMYVADTSQGGTVRIKIRYRSSICRGCLFSLNGRAEFLVQTFASS